MARRKPTPQELNDALAKINKGIAEGAVVRHKATITYKPSEFRVMHKRGKNPLRNMKKVIRLIAAESLAQVADETIEENKALLREQHEDSPFWTGTLEASLYHTEPEIRRDTISCKLCVDATNPNNGAAYAEFLEYGTGDKGVTDDPGDKDSGDGKKKWRYMDRQGNWHTTSGMAATPFLMPPVEKAIEKLRDQTNNNFEAVFNAHWYSGSKSLWKINESNARTLVRTHIVADPTRYKKK